MHFNDMKWLSKFKVFSSEIDDPYILAGLKDGNIIVDFRELEESDRKGESHYVVGGRAFFEVDVLGDKISSFTARGFFDKLDY